MKLCLKEFTKDDYQTLIGWIESPKFLLQWGGTIFRYPLTVEQLAHYNNNTYQNSPICKIYSVLEKDTNNHIGHIELNNIDFTNKSARICRVLIGDKNTKGKGYGKEIVQTIIKIGFEDLKLHRIDLNVFDFNTSAVKCYESVGFIHEGMAREARIMDNEYWNIIQMSMLETEYRDKYSK
ncbi:MAG TPA: GNAT family protein [Victivallales bacterium]|nr:GNAT family protein [Victivallales bacterium]